MSSRFNITYPTLFLFRKCSCSTCSSSHIPKRYQSRAGLLYLNAGQTVQISVFSRPVTFGNAHIIWSPYSAVQLNNIKMYGYPHWFSLSWGEQRKQHRTGIVLDLFPNILKRNSPKKTTGSLLRAQWTVKCWHHWRCCKPAHWDERGVRQSCSNQQKFYRSQIHPWEFTLLIKCTIRVQCTMRPCFLARKEWNQTYGWASAFILGNKPCFVSWSIVITPKSVV